MNELRLLGRCGAARLKVQLQYPASTLLLTAGHFLATAIDVIAIWALFDRFGAIEGWRFGDVGMFFGIVSISFAIADFLGRGFDVLGEEFLKTGDFDRLLLRPRTLTVQLVGYYMRASRIGRLLQGLIVVWVASRTIDLDWSVVRVTLTLWTIAGGVALFLGIIVLQGALSFWTTESLEAVNLLTYGGVQAAQYPLSIYERWFRTLLIYVVPLGCVAYFPVLAILGKHDPLGAPDWVLPVTPVAGFVFLALAFVAWRAGVAKYASTGS